MALPFSYWGEARLLLMKNSLSIAFSLRLWQPKSVNLSEFLRKAESVLLNQPDKKPCSPGYESVDRMHQTALKKHTHVLECSLAHILTCCMYRCSQGHTDKSTSIHTPTITLLFSSKQPEAQWMSMSAVWADILSHKEFVWNPVHPQPPLVPLPNIQTQRIRYLVYEM